MEKEGNLGLLTDLWSKSSDGRALYGYEERAMTEK